MEFVCMIDAVPADERPAHFALAADLFGRQAQERRLDADAFLYRAAVVCAVARPPR